MKNALMLILLFLSFSVSATTYYIDPSGNNSNNGSSNSPWKTLVYACSKATASGDIIHVNAGTYTETAQSVLAVGVSIVGVGNTSIIHSNVTAATKFTILLSSASQGTNGNQSISYIRMEGGMDAYGAILIDKRKNVNVNHCEFEDFFTRGITFTGSGYNSDAMPVVYATGNTFHDNILTNCADYEGSGHTGSGFGNLEIGGQEGLLVYNNTITQKDRGIDSNGFCIKYASNGYSKGLKIYNNTIIKPPFDGSTWDFSMELWNCRGGIEIYNNNVQGSIDFGGNTSLTNDAGGYGFAVKVYGNTLWQPVLRTREEIGIDIERGQAGGFYVYNNLFKNLTSALVMYQGNGDVFKDLYVYYNIFTTIGISGQPNYGNGINWQTIDIANITYDNINFLNNTIYAGTEGNPQSGLRFNFPGNATNLTVRNNIIQGFPACPIYMEIEGTISNVSIENNIFYNNGNNNNFLGDISSITHYINQNNIKNNPLFISSGDFHLLAGSPGIGKGLNITGLTTDYDGNALNNPPSIGAYEFSPLVLPVYQTSVVENSAPSLLKLIYNLSLAKITPANTSFAVMVNSAARTVDTVAVSGTNVLLTLASRVVYGDVVAVSYTKPTGNPLQTSSGGEAASISSKPVTNNCTDPNATDDLPVVLVNYPESVYAGFIGEIDASSTYDPNNDTLIAEWTVPNGVPVSTVKSFTTEFLAPVIENSQVVNFNLIVSNGKAILTNDIRINVLPYKPDLASARIAGIEASDFQMPDYPKNVLDGNTTTKWSSDGDNKWLLLKLAEPFKISHLVIAFLEGQKVESYFDIYASKDKITWEHILTAAASCKFSGDRQVFDFPAINTNTEYSYLKYIGHGNSLNYLNNVSEVKIYGTPQQKSITDNSKERNIIIYPNPAQDFFNISFDEHAVVPNSLRIIDFSGKVVFEDNLKQSSNKVQLPDSLYSGVYIVEFRSGTITLNTSKLIIKK